MNKYKYIEDVNVDIIKDRIAELRDRKVGEGFVMSWPEVMEMCEYLEWLMETRVTVILRK